VLAEINANVPVVAGDTRVHVDQLTYSIRTSRPLPEYHRATPSDLELRIAQYVARYIRDGSCLQIGIGKLGEAVLQSVTDRRDLGVHAGMVGDTMLEMMRAGIITNTAKDADRGLSVAGSILGSARALALAAEAPDLRIVSIAQTHDPARIAALSTSCGPRSARQAGTRSWRCRPRRRAAGRGSSLGLSRSRPSAVTWT
jgi:acetyl-CoA hydrolase